MRAAVEKVALAHSVITEFDSLTGGVTVPGRAHELVQHGAHLSLRRHLERRGGRRGPAESRRQRPTRPEARRALSPAPRVTGGAAPPPPRGEGESGRCPRSAFPVGSGGETRFVPEPVPVPPPRAPTRSPTPAPSRARHARAPAGTETHAHAPCAPSSAPRRQHGPASALAHWPRPAPLGQ